MPNRRVRVYSRKFQTIKFSGFANGFFFSFSVFRVVQTYFDLILPDWRQVPGPRVEIKCQMHYAGITKMWAENGCYSGERERWPLVEMTNEFKFLANEGSPGETAPHFDHL